MVKYYYTLTIVLALYMKISGKLLGSVDTIISGVSLHWHSCTYGLPLKLQLGHNYLFSCE